jgi:hypothetical protein
MLKYYMPFRLAGIAAAVAVLVSMFTPIGLTEHQVTKLTLLSVILLLGSEIAELRYKHNLPLNPNHKYYRIGLFVFCIGMFLSAFVN